MNKNPHAQFLGALGGKSKSEAKRKASALNGKKGGRPITIGKITALDTTPPNKV